MGKKAAVDKLLHLLHLYTGHKVDSRGPYGLILDTIEELNPKVAKGLRNGEPPDKFMKKE